MEYITELRQSDVLLGRGSGPNDHEGNIRFRQRVAERKSEYMATNHRLTKAKIAQEIVDTVYAENGRFLRRLEPDEAEQCGIPDGVDAWFPATEEVIMEKAKQALRQNTSKAKTSQTFGPSITSRLSPKLESKRTLSGTSNTSSALSPVGIASINIAAGTIPTTFDDFEPLPIRRPIQRPIQQQQQVAATATTATGGVPSAITDSRSSVDNGYGDLEPIPVRTTARLSVISPTSALPGIIPPQDVEVLARQQLPQHSLQQQQQQQQLHEAAIRHSQRDWMNNQVSAGAVGLGPSSPRNVQPGGGGGGRMQYIPPNSRTAMNHHHDDMPYRHPHQFEKNEGPLPVDEPEEDSILSSLPASVLLKYQAAMGVGGASSSTGSVNDQSQSALPEGGGDTATLDPGNRRGSMTMGELERFHARRKDHNVVRRPSNEDMVDLMDSVGKMSVSEQRRLMASTETMGTIEPIGLESMTDMSFMSMEGSMFSFVRGSITHGGNLLTPEERQRLNLQPQPPGGQGAGGTGSGTGMWSNNQHRYEDDNDAVAMPSPANRYPSSSSNSNNSNNQHSNYYNYSHNDGTDSDGKPVAGQLSRENENRRLDATVDRTSITSTASGGMPRPNTATSNESELLNYESMLGASSISMLANALLSQNDFDVPPINDPHGPEQQQQQQQQRLSSEYSRYSINEQQPPRDHRSDDHY